MDWQTLYTAGRLAIKPIFDKNEKSSLINASLAYHRTMFHCDRLHKPVNILEKHEDDEELEEALRSNLNSALHAALLLLPGAFALPPATN